MLTNLVGESGDVLLIPVEFTRAGSVLLLTFALGSDGSLLKEENIWTRVWRGFSIVQTNLEMGSGVVTISFVLFSGLRSTPWTFGGTGSVDRIVTEDVEVELESFVFSVVSVVVPSAIISKSHEWSSQLSFANIEILWQFTEIDEISIIAKFKSKQKIWQNWQNSFVLPVVIVDLAVKTNAAKRTIMKNFIFKV